MKTKNIFITAALIMLGSATGNNAKAQNCLKDYLITGTSAFATGMMDGTIESISYHYENGFKPRFKKANDKFWNPAQSWVNKYKNNDPRQGPKYSGSTTYLAWTTDAYHMLRTGKRTIEGATLVYYVNKNCVRSVPTRKKWKKAVKDFVILTAIRSAGFHLTYSALFRKQNNY